MVIRWIKITDFPILKQAGCYRVIQDCKKYETNGQRFWSCKTCLQCLKNTRKQECANFLRFSARGKHKKYAKIKITQCQSINENIL